MVARERSGVRLGGGARLIVLLLGVLAGGTPVYLYLPDQAVTAVLSVIFRPPERYDLSAVDLLFTWRLVLAGVSGLVICVLLAIGIGVARRRAHRRAVAAVPEPLRRLRAALSAGDETEVGAAAEAIGVSLGDEAVPDLLRALELARDDEARGRIAAALYRIGRAVTAEVELHPTR